MRIVLALGGNALLRRGEAPDAATQRSHLRGTMRDLARLAIDHEVLIVHGNGPQVGMLAEESAHDPVLTAPYPLGDLVAESQGLIGSWIQQELLNERCRSVVALVSQVIVDRDDPAFGTPTKPIGIPDRTGRRRLVPSPRPIDLLGLGAARDLVERGHVVVLGGGGGVPLVRHGHRLEQVEAVVDKDLVAALAADRLDADVFVVLTDVEGVYAGFRTPSAQVLGRVTPDELDDLLLEPGSMGPKASACATFVRGGLRRRAAIGALSALEEVVGGLAGTQVLPPLTGRLADTTTGTTTGTTKGKIA